MLEEDVLGQIRQLLEVNGARVFRAIERVPKCYRCGQWLGSSEPGTPDLSGFFPKKVFGSIFPFWLEIKRPKRAQKRLAQIARISQIDEDGGCAAIVSSWEQVKDAFSRHGINFKIG